MKAHGDVEITVIPPRIEEDEVYIQPREEDTNCILGNFLDENQMDGFSIFKEGTGYEEGNYDES